MPLTVHPRFTSYVNHGRKLTLSTTNHVLVPLPSWLLIVAAIAFLVQHFVRSRPSNSSSLIRTIYRRYWFPHHLTSVLIVLSIAMSVLELARLGASGQDFNALYFTPIGFFLALVMHISLVSNNIDGQVVTGFEGPQMPRRCGLEAPSGIRRPLIVYWVLELVFQLLKVGVLGNLQHSTTPDHALYHRSDQILDLSVLAGLQVVLIVLEFFPGQGVAKLKARMAADDRSNQLEMDHSGYTKSQLHRNTFDFSAAPPPVPPHPQVNGYYDYTPSPPVPPHPQEL